MAACELPGGYQVQGDRGRCRQTCRYYVSPGACAIDVANEGAHHLSQVAALEGISTQRVSQLEKRAIRKIRRRFPKIAEFIEWHDTESPAALLMDEAPDLDGIDIPEMNRHMRRRFKALGWR